MDLKAMILFILLTASVLSQSIDYNLSDQTIEKDWDTIQRFLKGQKVIRIYQEGISEDNMNKILSLQLPKLQQMHFQYEKPQDTLGYQYFGRLPQILTHSLVKTIFTSDYFPRLKVLNLKKTNIDDRYLSFLQNLKLKTSLNQLNLQNCFIGRKGFQYLSNIQFDNLKVLNLTGSSLVEEEAIDALITIICGDISGKCKNDLQKINLSQTSITRGLFIKLMSRINADPLKQLQMSTLSLIYKKTYKQGFDYSAFEVLSKRFFNLEWINMEKSLLDDQIASIFQKWALPNLYFLNIADNLLTDDGVKLWINKKNMPNLQVLALSGNPVSDSTIYHIINEKYEFVKFYFGDCRLTSEGAKSLTKLKTTSLQKLHLEIPMPSQILNSFIQDGNLKNLKDLTIIQNDLLTDAFIKIDWKNLKSLKSLTISHCSLKQSFAQLFTSFTGKASAIIPSLEYLVLNDVDLDQQTVVYILLTLSLYFPKLRQLIIMQQNNLDQISLLTQILDVASFEEGLYININNLQFIKRGSKYQLINLPNPVFLFYSKSNQELTLQVIYSKLAKIGQKYNFATIEEVTFANRQLVNIFFTTLDELKLERLPYLRKIQINQYVDVDFLILQLNEIELPSLRHLSVSILVHADAPESYIDTLLNLFKKFRNINTLLLQINFLNETHGFIQKKKFLDSLYFPHLTQIVMINQNMEVQEVATFIRNHNQTLRSLDLGNNFMEKDLLRILVQQEFALARISLASTSFVVDQFAVLGEINTQFIELLLLIQNDLTNQHILALLKQNKTGPLFPKLKYLDLQSNDIRKQGLTALLQNGLHELVLVILNKNSNPQFINILLTYPTRIMLVVAEQVQIYGLDSTLDPRSARNIRKIMLNTKSFLKQDFHNLAKLQFARLKGSQFSIYNAYDCQVLTDLLKINEWGINSQMIFANDDIGLNSSCLNNMNYTSHAWVIDVKDKYGTTYIPEFIQKIFNTSMEIKSISLFNTRLPPSFFKKIFKKQYSQLWVLSLTSNYVGDDAARDFLSRQLGNLRMLDFSNTDITDITLDAFAHAKLPELIVLMLDENNFSVKGIRSLSNLPKKLMFLTLSRCGLTGQSLKVLGEIYFPGLGGLFLQYNQFTGADLLEFASTFDRKTFPKLAYLLVKGIDMSKEEYDGIVDAFKPKMVKVELDYPHNIVKINSAKY